MIALMIRVTRVYNQNYIGVILEVNYEGLESESYRGYKGVIIGIKGLTLGVCKVWGLGFRCKALGGRGLSEGGLELEARV